MSSLTGMEWDGSGVDALEALEDRDDLPRSVRELLTRAMSPNPANRFPTVAALLHTLDRAIGGDSSLAGIGITPTNAAPNASDDAQSAADAQEARLRMVTGLDYELIARLGGGMMGDVWRAHDLALNRDVALKALKPEIASDAAAVSRLRREARLVASLAHPRIVPVLEFAERAGIAYFTMAYTPGGSLENCIATDGPLPLEAVGPQIDALLDGIATAHSAGIVHRDIKPENILLDRDGRWCLADFGIAGAPGERGAMGTLAFAAPEQLRGEPQDERVDRYAIAAVVFYALTGHLPFVSRHPARQMDRQAAGVYWSASWAARIPPSVQSWLTRALAFKADDRFDNTSAMRDAWNEAWQPSSEQPNEHAPGGASMHHSRKGWGDLSAAWRRMFEGMGNNA
ncbi:MAG: serine/threonine-protein kinase [Gemmatimonadaceae bacterium]